MLVPDLKRQEAEENPLMIVAAVFVFFGPVAVWLSSFGRFSPASRYEAPEKCPKGATLQKSCCRLGSLLF